MVLTVHRHNNKLEHTSAITRGLCTEIFDIIFRYMFRLIFYWLQFFIEKCVLLNCSVLCQNSIRKVLVYYPNMYRKRNAVLIYQYWIIKVVKNTSHKIFSRISTRVRNEFYLLFNSNHPPSRKVKEAIKIHSVTFTVLI